MAGYIYLIESKKWKKCYLGSTDNPTRRIKEHNEGKNKSTQKGVPWKCLLIIKIENLQKARKIEFYLKRNKEKLTVKNIIKILNKYFDNNSDD